MRFVPMNPYVVTCVRRTRNSSRIVVSSRQFSRDPKGSVRLRLAACSPAAMSVIVLILIATNAPARAEAQETRVDLASANAAQWKLLDKTASIQSEELVLDGRTKMSRALYMPLEWRDVTLEASFLVEPQETGVLACGFVVRATDAANYYYVHFDKTQAILVRSNEDWSWNEIKRKSGLAKPAGKWHRGRLECVGETLRVYLNGKLLYEAKDTTLQSGRIGFYANKGRAHVKDIVVTGQPQATSAPFVTPPRKFVHVCEDAGAGAYEAFPDVCRLKDGRLMCVFYAGYGHVALPNEKLPKGGRVSYCLSADEGRTWSDAKTLYDGPDDDRDPSIVQLSGGRLLCNFFSLRKSTEAGKRWTGLGSWLVESSDLGKTWSKPRQISGRYYCSAPIRELPGGRLILGLYAETAGKAHGAVITSDDGGRSWNDVVDIDNGGYRLDAETDVIRLKDGRLFAAQRARGKTMCWSESTDNGDSWSVAKPFGFPGHCPYLHRTVDGIILMGHRLPATSLHYSTDEAKTWSKNVPVDSVGGAYPSMVNLTDGTVLIVYYEEGGGSSIRAKRLRATPAGIDWLPLD